MGSKTGINWCDSTWNPIRGCSRVSEGCRHCYAERVAARFCGPGQPYHGLAQVVAPRDSPDRVGGRRNGWTGEVRLVAEHLADPLRWRRPRTIFVNSMSDLFHERLTNEQIAAVFGVMAACQQHTFLVLTKRAEGMRAWFEWVQKRERDGMSMFPADAPAWRIGQMLNVAARNAGAETKHGNQPWPLPNVWLGVSVENQAAADERIPHLLATPAAVRWLSCEPLLGPVDLPADAMSRCEHCDKDGVIRRADGAHAKCELQCGVSWVVAGCESGPGARPCEVAWMRSLRDQCASAGVPFWLKQARDEEDTCSDCGDVLCDNDDGDVTCTCCGNPGSKPVITTGLGSKRKPGGIIDLPYLDGVQHAARPEGHRG